MTNELTPSDVVGARVRQIRRRRDWKPAELAERCKSLGAPGLTASVINDIETGRRTDGRRRRQVSVDELLALAAALNWPPVMLLTPDEDTAPYHVTPKVTESAFAVRGWIRGAGPIGGADPREYLAALPVNEFYTVHGQVSAQQRFLGWEAVKEGDDGQD